MHYSPKLPVRLTRQLSAESRRLEATPELWERDERHRLTDLEQFLYLNNINSLVLDQRHPP